MAIVKGGNLGFSVCKEVLRLSFAERQGVQINKYWINKLNKTKTKITALVVGKKNKQSSLRTKICRHRQSETYQKAVPVLENASEMVLEIANQRHFNAAITATHN